MKKIFAITLCIAMIAVCFSTIFAAPTDPYDASLVNPALKTKAKNTWATVVVIVQILAVGCVVFAGLRYMFASADQRADIKQGLIYLGVGAVLVFAATTVISVVAKAAKDVM